MACYVPSIVEVNELIYLQGHQSMGALGAHVLAIIWVLGPQYLERLLIIQFLLPGAP